MALYFLDCEFNSFEGQLISMAIVRQDGEYLFLQYPLPDEADIHPWVKENVIPVLNDVPDHVEINHVNHQQGAYALLSFLRDDPQAIIVADWPGDISHFCNAIMPEPGQMVVLNNLVFQLVRAQAYPTDLEGAVQHNAWWDAMALRAALIK